MARETKIPEGSMCECTDSRCPGCDTGRKAGSTLDREGVLMPRHVWYRPDGTQRAARWERATLIRAAVSLAAICVENKPARKGRRRICLVVPLAHLAERRG